MGPISIIAEAGLDILRRIASGELEVHGILLRDAASKKFRYILRGFEGLPRDKGRLNDLPPFEPLQAAVNLTQLLQVVAVAQNAAVAASLRRIEAKLAAIDERLDGIERRLQGVQTKQTLLLKAMHTAPIGRLKAAKTAAMVALPLRDRTALISAGRECQQASHDLLEQATHMVRIEEDGLPVALLAPREHADLVDGAAMAGMAASAIWLSLDATHAASSLLYEAADAIQTMRRKLSGALEDPELMLRRMRADRGRDAELVAAGRRLRDIELWARGRGILIEQGLATSDPERLEFERMEPAQGLSFVPIREMSDR